MKKQVFALVLLFSLPSLVFAEATVISLEKEVATLKKEVEGLKVVIESMKEAYLDLDEVFALSDEYKDELIRVEKDMKTKEAEFMKLKKEHDELVSKLQTAGSTMKEDAREKTIEKISELRQKMETKQRMVEQKMQQERVAVQTKIMESTYQAAANIADKKGFAKINPMCPKKMVFNRNLDVTKDVVAELNKMYKASKAGSGQEASKEEASKKVTSPASK